MRILIVSHPPLSQRSGASQIALELAAALRERGHDARAWSPEPLPASAQWWNIWWWQRRRLEDHLRTAAPYSLIDAPAVSISTRVAAAGPVVVRSVQPDLRYAWANLKAALHPTAPQPRVFLGQLALTAIGLPLLVEGWRRARAILCLGTHEMHWMARRFPWTRGKLECYVGATSRADQEALATVRTQRRHDGGAVRYLWIGRWAAHKGPGKLVRFVRQRLSQPGRETFTLAGCTEVPRQHFAPALLEGGRLRIVPAFSRAELPALLAAHDAGLFTSSVEGWGLSLNEMLEAGMPVFATRAGGVEDLAPFFPSSLLPFPPPLGFRPGPRADDPGGRGYYRRFCWEEIARSYEATVIRRVVTAAPGPARTRRRSESPETQPPRSG